MEFRPVEASKEITEKYKRYLRTIFDIADKDYAEQFRQELNKDNVFSSGPYLDVTDSFVKGISIKEMIENGKLPKSFDKIKIPMNRPLYKHQETAMDKVSAGNNVVVSTGTGSGKTESFLYPILSHLVKESEAGTLDEGVRALLIYPMNALANDQIERLREILADFPEITFGSYTGQTKEKHKEALSEYKALNNNSKPPENQIISRDQMKEKPPHILITNYSMLEYLMLRPEDSIFFSQYYADKWKYIVLDEAHVYHGSTGIEVSMLLRRLKATLSNKKLQYILTSATLGSENENADVARFARDLCDSTFQESDVIRAERIVPKPERESKNIGNEFYERVASLIIQGVSDIEIRNQISEMLQINDHFSSLGEMLYDIIMHDQLYWKIRELMVRPLTIYSLSGKLKMDQNQVENFVAVATKCDKDGDKLFDARYHMFLRASESVFITLNPNKKLFLTRKKQHIENDGKSYHVFEIATCTSCHSIYLVGKEEENYLNQASSFFEGKARVVFLLSDSIQDTDEDHLMENEKIEAEAYEVCARCGHLHKVGRPDSKRCEHGKESYVKVIRVKINNEAGKLTKCLACENSSTFSMLRYFFTGQEAVTSVIGTALFEAIPAYSFKSEVKDAQEGMGSFGIRVQDTEKQAKQFLAFSDNRQAAAYYASYLDQTYKGILYKRLILETLNKVPQGGLNIPDFVERLIFEFQTKNIHKENQENIRKSAWKAILKELVDNNGNTSMNRMGLLSISIDPTNIIAVPDFKLSQEDVVSLYSIFAMGMMAEGAIINKGELNDAEKAYYLNGVEYSFTLSDSNPKGYKRSFIPTKAHGNNKRLDYFSRVLEKSGYSIETEKRIEFLQDIWNGVLAHTATGILLHKDGKYQLNPEKIYVVKDANWYICSKCRKITSHNVKGVCPTYRCDGELRKVNIDELYQDNHYYQMYQNLDIKELRVKEHTAQLNKERAYDYQKKFKQKELDILSCSTTFEMGVDVGTLETVFMRNMPPSPANYAQRAGRAGRSSHSAAYALTFCNKSNHDFTFFKTPDKMIRGKIKPPKFNIENDKIAIRHLYASALGMFWKRHKEYFAKTADMIDEVEGLKSGIEAFEEYLKEKPNDLKLFLNDFLPPSLKAKYAVDIFGWMGSLLQRSEDEPGILNKAVAEYHYEVNILKNELERARQEKKYKQCDILSQRIKVYEKENILAFLSRKNVLPKYGFPVDTVELSILGGAGKSNSGLQLQRDLSIAISEYAPGSQIVANDQLITSRFIRKMPNMSWKMYDYKYCPKCKTLNLEPHMEYHENSELNACVQCEESLSEIERKTFIIPSFGFEADSNIEKPGLIKPERTFKSEIAYVGYKSMDHAHKYKIGNAEVSLQFNKGDEMAVLNQSNFYVCESCGYTELDNKAFFPTKKHSHKTSTGHHCQNDGTNTLKKYSIGYRFETDVIQIRFMEKELSVWEEAISVLYGLLRGVSAILNVEQSEIACCLQYYINNQTGIGNFGFVLYDTTPGGAGHVRRLEDPIALEKAIEESIRIMKNCTCGGEDGDSSCYTCLRSYYNQKYHDHLQRKFVINYLSSLKETKAEANKLNAKFNKDGVDLSEKSMREVWEYIKLDTNEDDEVDLFNKLITEPPDFATEIPKYGASILIVDSKESLQTDLLWPESKVLFFLKDKEDDYRIAQRTNWNSFCLADGIDVKQMLDMIKEK